MAKEEWPAEPGEEVSAAQVVEGVASGSGEWALNAARLGFDEVDYSEAASGFGGAHKAYWGLVDAIADLQLPKSEQRPRSQNDMDLVLASVMDTDMEGLHALMMAVLGEDRLAGVVERARPGEFSLKHWLRWHKKLALVNRIEEALPMPRRFPIKLEELGPFDEPGIQLALHRGDREVWETLRDACRASQKLDEVVTRVCESGGSDPWGKEDLRAWMKFTGKRALEDIYGTTGKF